MHQPKIRVITTRTDVPENTVSKPGFQLINMGKEGPWLVDEQHPGYARCLVEGIKIAFREKDLDRIKKYEDLQNKIVAPDPAPKEAKKEKVTE